jgi:hypothetical protein
MTQRFFRRARLGFFHRLPLYGPLAPLMQGSDGEGAFGANLATKEKVTSAGHVSSSGGTLAACHHAASWRRDQPAHEALN